MNQDTWNKIFIYLFTNNLFLHGLFKNYYAKRMPKGIYLYGDSLNSPRNSWANVINRELGSPHIQVQAMPGMVVSRLTPLEWQEPTKEIDTVMVFMGTNDAGQDLDFRPEMRDMVDYAEQVNLDLIWVQIPPNVEKDFENYHNLPHTRDYSKHREYITNTVDTVITIPTFLSDTPDGLHMGPKGQREFAANMIVSLSKLYDTLQK
jgi:lysophospholipase L1-like esterase